eukprot:599370-Lingulodinium_polyedra.AAC.1
MRPRWPSGTPRALQAWPCARGIISPLSATVQAQAGSLSRISTGSWTTSSARRRVCRAGRAGSPCGG